MSVFMTKQLDSSIANDSRNTMPLSFVGKSQKWCTITSAVFCLSHKATHEYGEKGILGEYLSIPLGTTNTVENGEAGDELMSVCPTRVILFYLFRTLCWSKKQVSLKLGENTLLKTLYISREKLDSRMFQ